MDADGKAASGMAGRFCLSAQIRAICGHNIFGVLKAVIEF